MTTNWQSLFDSWAKPPSDTEIDERDHTEKQVKNALQAWPAPVSYTHLTLPTSDLV